MYIYSLYEWISVDYIGVEDTIIVADIVVVVVVLDGYICTGNVSLVTRSLLLQRPAGSNCTIGTDGNTVLYVHADMR